MEARLVEVFDHKSLSFRIKIGERDITFDVPKDRLDYYTDEWYIPEDIPTNITGDVFVRVIVFKDPIKYMILVGENNFMTDDIITFEIDEEFQLISSVGTINYKYNKVYNSKSARF